ncbi:MAG: zinc ribbon domain-containing protein [Caldilineaceae bacterium]
MIWTTLFLALLIAGGAAAFVLWPLLSHTAPDVPIEDDRLTELISRKDGVLVAIKDLEFDRQVGKLSEEDYERFNARLRQQAIGYLQQIDKLAPQSAHLDEMLEVEIARLRKTRPASVAVNGKTAPVPVAVAVPIAPGAARFCTNCGQPLTLEHKFCANCGTAT